MTQTYKLIRLVIFILLSGFSATAQSNAKASILKQVNELKKAVLLSDEEKVASYFDFPINSEELKLRTQYAGEEELTINQFDKKTFLQNYNRIITDDILNLFRQVDFSTLKDKKKIEKKIIPNNKVETCYYTYLVEITANGIKISLATNTRTDIEVKKESGCPEYAETWNFKLKNGRLKLDDFTAAG